MDMITKVISGCQTGADHTGLTVAKEFGIDTGGWCPPRCATENGDRPEFIAYFGLKETIQHGYKPRTILNVRDCVVWAYYLSRISMYQEWCRYQAEASFHH
jgi:hypothetical protein